MKKLVIIIGILGYFIIQGCSNEDAKKNNSGVNSSDQIQNNADVINPDLSQPVMSEDPVEMNTSQAPAPVAAGMYPMHGEPGHRCDIAVGAPLNSPPGKIPEPTIINVEPDEPSGITTAEDENGHSQSTQVPQVAAPPLSGPTPPGMNPPHGEPGHDCAVPVGAPLKKK